MFSHITQHSSSSPVTHSVALPPIRPPNLERHVRGQKGLCSHTSHSTLHPPLSHIQSHYPLPGPQTWNGMSEGRRVTVPPTGAYAHERCVPFSVVSMRVEEQAIILGEQGNLGGGGAPIKQGQ